MEGYKQITDVNHKDEYGHIVQGNRVFIEYRPGFYSLYKKDGKWITEGKTFTYCQCPDCGKIWACGCGFAKHKCHG